MTHTGTFDSSRIDSSFETLVDAICFCKHCKKKIHLKMFLKNNVSTASGKMYKTKEDTCNATGKEE